MYQSTKVLKLGSCAFRQPNAAHNRIDAGSNSKRCSYIHGYLLTAKFWFNCSSLDDKNWCVDFGGLSELKNVLENQFDHTLTVSSSDPLLSYFQRLHDLGGCDLRIMDGVGIEKTAEWCFYKADEIIKRVTDGRCWVEKVEVWEHAENSATFQL